MSLEIGGDGPGIAVELPEAVSAELPEHLAETVREAVSEGIAAAISEMSEVATSVPDRLSALAIPRNLPARIADRVRSLSREVRIPRLTWDLSPSELEELLGVRDWELAAKRAQASRNLQVGLAVGLVAGAATVIALLPNRKERIAEIRARIGGIDAPTEYVEDARRLAVRARESVAERIRVARDEAKQAEEATKRDLWAKYQVAKRDGHMPPEA